MEQKTVGGKVYLIGELGTFDAFEVCRAMSFTLTGIANIRQETAKAGKPVTPHQFVRAIAALSSQDEGVVMAINKCLSVVKRRIEADTGWQPVLTVMNTLQFADIKMRQMLELVWYVMEVNQLVDFFLDEAETSDALAKA